MADRTIPTDNTARHKVSHESLAVRPKDAAKLLGIGERLLWSLTNRGEIPCVRLGRCVIYPVDQLRTWLGSRAEGGKQ